MYLHFINPPSKRINNFTYNVRPSQQNTSISSSYPLCYYHILLLYCYKLPNTLLLFIRIIIFQRTINIRKESLFYFPTYLPYPEPFIPFCKSKFPPSFSFILKLPLSGNEFSQVFFIWKFISHSFSKDIFIGYRILSWYFFSAQHIKDAILLSFGFHCFLFCFFVRKLSFFSLALFKIFLSL